MQTCSPLGLPVPATLANKLLHTILTATAHAKWVW